MIPPLGEKRARELIALGFFNLPASRAGPDDQSGGIKILSGLYGFIIRELPLETRLAAAGAGH